MGLGRELREKAGWLAITTLAFGSVLLHELGVEVYEAYTLPSVIAAVAIFAIYEIIEERELTIEHVVAGMMVLVGVLTYRLNLHIEGAMVLGLYGIAELLEHLAMERAEAGLRELIEYMPRSAKVVRDGEVLEVGPEEIRAGDRVIVARGDRVPVDGVVEEGRGSVDQSIVTGEPIPVEASEGSFVYAGSLLLEGSLVVRAVRGGGETLLSKMLTLVERFKERKSKAERLVIRFSKVYLPVMLALAAVSTVYLGLERSIALIAVSCPSAFLVAVPATTLASLAISAKRGVLFKGTLPIEKASSIRVVALDKTGTVTLGKPKVRQVISSGDFTSEEILRLTASLEIASEHPIAKAITMEARERGLKLSAPTEVQEIPGVGIAGRVDGKQILVGKRELLLESGLEAPEISNQGMVIHVAADGRHAGAIILGDEVNPKAVEVIRELRAMGMNVVVLTGDRRESAETVVKALGVDEFYPELTPEDKVRLIQEFRGRFDAPVAMVGDGINDAPALAAADLGVAVGSIEAAIEAGDVALVAGLGTLPWLFRLSRVAVRKAWQNLGIILVSKALGAILGVVGTIPLWAAVAIGDDGGLLLTTANVLLMVRTLLLGRPHRAQS